MTLSCSANTKGCGQIDYLKITAITYLYSTTNWTAPLFGPNKGMKYLM